MNERRSWFAVRRPEGGHLVVVADTVERDADGTARLLRDGRVVYQLPADVLVIETCGSQKEAEERVRGWREAATGATLSLQESGVSARPDRGGPRRGVVPLEGVRIRVSE